MRGERFFNFLFIGTLLPVLLLSGSVNPDTTGGISYLSTAPAGVERNGHQLAFYPGAAAAGSPDSILSIEPVKAHKVGPQDDPARPMLMTPGLTWHTFLGSATASDIGWGVAVDSSGNTYIAGESSTSWGTPARAYSGNQDGFVARLNNSGQLVWHTFLGSISDDIGYGVTVDTAGNVYVVGTSFAAWQGSSPPRRNFSAGQDVFIAKLNSSGQLQWNTFLGGSAEDLAESIAVDQAGNVYVSGYSRAAWGSPVASFVGSGINGFVARLNTNGNLTWHTFMGANGFTVIAWDLAVNSAGSAVYIAGESAASWGPAPVHGFSGGPDAFAARFNSSTGALTWNTFWGSGGLDGAGDIALDNNGDVYISGLSVAPWAGAVPVNPHAGALDAFAAKINDSNGQLLWHTFMGAAGADDKPYDIDVSGSQNVYIIGRSTSSWGAPIGPYRGGDDAFVARLNGNGVRQWHTFAGSLDHDLGTGLAVDPQENIYISGFSNASWLGNPVQPYHGARDAFAARLPPNPFLVNGINPGNGRIVAAGSTISATFNRAVNPGSVTPHTFLIRGRQNGLYPGAYSGSVQFKPSQPFHAGEEITITLGSGLRAAGDGGSLVPYTWQVWAAVSGGSGTFSSSQGLVSKDSRDVALGDLDGDGDLDAFVTNANGRGNEVWLYSSSSGTFINSGQSLGDRDSQAVALGDLDGDGDLDAVAANYNQASQVWLNQSGKFTAGQNLFSLLTRDAALGDLDGDGDLDAFFANDGQGDIVLFNNGAAGFFLPALDLRYVLGNTNSQDAALGDLDGDGDLDAFVANYQQPAKIWLNNGTGAFFDSGQNPGSSSGRSVALGDLDGDGDLDAFVGNSLGLGEPNRVWLNNGGIFAPGQSTGDANTRSVALGDLDADGDLDAFVGNLAGNEVWLNNGKGTFSKTGQNAGHSATYAVALGDIDRDGDLDAFAGGFLANQGHTVWLNLAGAAGESLAVYLPAISKSDPASLQVNLYIHSIKTGGIANVTIRNPANNQVLLMCGPIGNDQRALCGQFPPVGTYEILVQPTKCEAARKTFHDAAPGHIVTRSVECNG